MESDQARLCPHTASTRRFCSGHGCSFLWNILLHGNYCVTSGKYVTLVLCSLRSLVFCFTYNIQSLNWFSCLFFKKRLETTKQSSNGTWRHPATERKRNQLTQFLERCVCFCIILNNTAMHQVNQEFCKSLVSMVMISNSEYCYSYIVVKMILVPRRRSSQDWTITKKTTCFQRAASRWTFGTSREPVRSAPSPGAWTASAASALTLWR